MADPNISPDDSHNMCESGSPLVSPDGAEESNDAQFAGIEAGQGDRTPPVRVSEEQYHALFAASPIPFFVLSPEPPDFIFIAANEAYLAVTRTTRAHLIGRKVFDVFTDDPSRPGALGPDVFRASLSRVLETRRPDALRRTRYDIPRPGGGFEERWWLAISAPVLDASGRITSMIHQVTDVTAQHLVEVAEQEHQARQSFLLKLSDALRPLADAVEIKTTATRLLGQQLGVNRAVYAEAADDDWLLAGGFVQGVEPLLEGRSPMDQFGRWIIDGFQAGQRLIVRDVRTDARFEMSQRAAHEAMQIIGAAAVPLVKDGALVAILVVQHATPRDWPDSDVALLEQTAERTWAAVARARVEAKLWAALEETELARAEAERATQAKDRFLAILSHELRTPLTPVLMAAQILARDGALPAAARNAAAIIERNARLQAQLVDDLLDVTRIASGKMELSRERISLHDVIARAVEVSNPDIDGKNQQLTLELAAGGDIVYADSKRMQQVFWNLLKNASKFTPEGGRIVVCSRNESGLILVDVRDTGMGFEPAVAERIFTAFEQAGRNVTRQFGGLGLGLAIARATVQAHGGSVGATSAGAQCGATFTLGLPIAAES